MSAAFDWADQSSLLLRLERNFGVTGLALQWMTSFLTDRTQQVAYGTSCTVQVGAKAMHAASRGARCWALYFSTCTCTRQTFQQSSGVSLSLQAASVRRRLPGLPQCSCNRGSDNSRPVLSVRRQTPAACVLIHRRRLSSGWVENIR